MESSIGQMENYMMDNGPKVNSMELENRYQQKEKLDGESGQMAKGPNGSKMEKKFPSNDKYICIDLS